MSNKTLAAPAITGNTLSSGNISAQGLNLNYTGTLTLPPALSLYSSSTAYCVYVGTTKSPANTVLSAYGNVGASTGTASMRFRMVSSVNYGWMWENDLGTTIMSLGSYISTPNLKLKGTFTSEGAVLTSTVSGVKPGRVQHAAQMRDTQRRAIQVAQRAGARKRPAPLASRGPEPHVRNLNARTAILESGRLVSDIAFSANEYGGAAFDVTPATQLTGAAVTIATLDAVGGATSAITQGANGVLVEPYLSAPGIAVNGADLETVLTEHSVGIASLMAATSATGLAQIIQGAASGISQLWPRVSTDVEIPPGWGDTVGLDAFSQGLDPVNMAYDMSTITQQPAGSWANALGETVTRAAAATQINSSLSVTGECDLGSMVTPLLGGGVGAASLSAENPRVCQFGLNARVLYDGTVEAVNFTADGEVWADSVSAPLINGTRPARTQHAAMAIASSSRGVHMAMRGRAHSRHSPAIRKLADPAARRMALRMQTRDRAAPIIRRVTDARARQLAWRFRTRARPSVWPANRSLARVANMAAAASRKRRAPPLVRVNGAETKRLRTMVAALPATSSQQSSARWRAIAGATAQRDLRTRHQLLRMRARFGRQAVPSLTVLKRLTRQVFALMRKRKGPPPARDLSREVKRLRTQVASPSFAGNASVAGTLLLGSASTMGPGVGISLLGATASPNWAMYLSPAGAGNSWTGGTACAGSSGGTLTNTAVRLRVPTTLYTGFIVENAAEECLMSVGSTGYFYAKQGVNSGGTMASATTLTAGTTLVTGSTTSEGNGLGATFAAGATLDPYAIYAARAGAARSWNGGTAVAGGGSSGVTGYCMRLRVGAAATQGLIVESQTESLLMSLGGTGAAYFAGTVFANTSLGTNGNASVGGDLTVTGAITAASCGNVAHVNVLNANARWASPLQTGSLTQGTTGYQSLSASFTAQTDYVKVTFSGHAYYTEGSGGKFRWSPRLKTGTTYITGDSGTYSSCDVTQHTTAPFTWEVPFAVTAGTAYSLYYYYSVIYTGATFYMYMDSVTVTHMAAFG